MEVLFREKKNIERVLETERTAQLKGEFNRNQQESNRKEKLAQERIKRNAKIVEVTKAQLGFGATFKDIVYSLVLNGQHSAVAISFTMIDDFGYDNKMSMSIMNRPRNYCDDLEALMKQVKIGTLIRDESTNIMDCIFHVNPYPEEDTNINNQEEQQQSLSLF